MPPCRASLHLKDAERLVRRLIANELILSFVPDGEQRIWRSMARMKLQLTRDRVRLQNQMECLLEEMRIRLSIVVSDLLGAGGLRILRALAQGETDPKQLAQLGDERLQCTEEQLVDALTGRAQPMHRAMLGLQLERLQLIDTQIAKLNSMIAQAMKPHQEAVIRLAEVPGLGVDSAPQVIAEVGAQASRFPAAAALTSWVGTCPGKDESAEENHSSRSAKGNKYLRRVLNQAAHAAVKKNGQPLSGGVPASAAAAGLDDQLLFPSDWSRDGKYILSTAVYREPRIFGLCRSREIANPSRSCPARRTRFRAEPKLSPDGRWLAYGSNESGSSQAYVVAFKGGSGKWQVSSRKRGIQRRLGATTARNFTMWTPN